MCIGHSAFYFITLFLTSVMICIWVYYNLKCERLERVIDRLELENDDLGSEIYDLEERLDNERTRFKATVNLLSNK